MVYTLMQTMILFDPGTKHFLHIWFCGFKLEDVYIITMTLHSILSLRQKFFVTLHFYPHSVKTLSFTKIRMLKK